MSYPCFKLPDDKRAFEHWTAMNTSILSSEFPSSPVCKCWLCELIYDRVRRGTKLLLETLLISNKALLNGSDIASLGMGRISTKCARACLHGKDDREAFSTTMKRMFPGLSLAPLVMEGNYMFAPIIDNGGHSLISLLSRFYNEFTMTKGDELEGEDKAGRIPFYARLRFICLSFHLSQTYLLTSDAVWQMWTDTLCQNSITSLFNVSQ